MTTTQSTDLNHMVGTWDMAMHAGGEVSHGTANYARATDSRWLVSTTECAMFGSPFIGHGLEAFDADRAVYTSVWVDNMSASPVVMEGAHDPAAGGRVMTGTGPGMDRRPTAYRSLTTTPDADTVNLVMHIGDGPDPAFTAVYTRRK